MFSVRSESSGSLSTNAEIIQEQVHQAHLAEERDDEQARVAQFRERCKSATATFDAGTLRLLVREVKRFGRMAHALQYEEDNRGMCVFARDKPCPDERTERIKTKKQYMVANLACFFRYLHDIDTGVAYDEVVRADHQTPLHFDVKIKRLVEGDLSSPHLAAMVRSHLEGLDLFPEGDPEVHKRLTDAYKRVALSELCEDECPQGLGVIKQHIKHMVTLAL